MLFILLLSMLYIREMIKASLFTEPQIQPLPIQISYHLDFFLHFFFFSPSYFLLYFTIYQWDLLFSFLLDENRINQLLCYWNRYCLLVNHLKYWKHWKGGKKLNKFMMLNFYSRNFAFSGSKKHLLFVKIIKNLLEMLRLNWHLMKGNPRDCMTKNCSKKAKDFIETV